MSATQRQARPRSLLNCVVALEAPLERMIATQMLAYPDHWSPADKREAAQLHLFGTVERGDLSVDDAMALKEGIAG